MFGNALKQQGFPVVDMGIVDGGPGALKETFKRAYEQGNDASRLFPPCLLFVSWTMHPIWLSRMLVINSTFFIDAIGLVSCFFCKFAFQSLEFTHQFQLAFYQSGDEVVFVFFFGHIELRKKFKTKKRLYFIRKFNKIYDTVELVYDTNVGNLSVGPIKFV